VNRRADTNSLRRNLKQLAEEFDTGLSQRYALLFPPAEPSFYQRLRANPVRLLRRLGLIPPPQPRPLQPWLTELEHVDYGKAAKPLLIWAIGIGRDELRAACETIRKSQIASRGWAPVLVTDVADFAFFSRLSWLVEYVPTLSAPADGYYEHKLRYLAWRYRDVPALPATVEIGEDMLLEDLLLE
jgi:hypothetical protein